jgi:hypothetical protein
LVDGQLPESGEPVKLLGPAAVPQLATVEIVAGRRLLLRTDEQLRVDTPVELQYLVDGELHSLHAVPECTNGDLWWLDVKSAHRVQRRRVPRVSLEEKAAVLVPNDTGVDALLVTLTSMSVQGCSFTGTRRLSRATTVEIRCRADEERVRVSALVLECRPTQPGTYRVRCRFAETDSATEARLARWIERVALRTGQPYPASAEQRASSTNF